MTDIIFTEEAVNEIGSLKMRYVNRLMIDISKRMHERPTSSDGNHHVTAQDVREAAQSMQSDLLQRVREVLYRATDMVYRHEREDDTITYRINEAVVWEVHDKSCGLLAELAQGEGEHE